jgi:hypothetical protein
MPDIRDTLFGDNPLDAWPSGNAPPGEPWTSFVKAREALAAGRKAEAFSHWQRIIAMPDLESRHYLQAWHFLRAQGVSPPPELAKQILGIVVEVGMKDGLDLLAAYPDHHARYYNFSGSAVIWEHPNNSLDAQIDALLSAGSRVLSQIGPWTQRRPAPPPADHIRMNFLSAMGLHFGQGALKSFATDPLAKPTFDAALVLMESLIAQGK